jgi:hypothetical protein
MSVKPITDTLRRLRGGLFVDECSDLFAAIVKGVEDTGKTGKLTITLDVKKVNAAISVLAKVTDKVPEAVPDADLFWSTPEGNLTVENPNQRSLELREVGKPDVVPRNVDPETGEIRGAA